MPSATIGEKLDYAYRVSQGDTRTVAERNYTSATKANSVSFASPVFRQACALAGIPLTRCQASKWNARRDLAYAHRAEAIRAIAVGAE